MESIIGEALAHTKLGPRVSGGICTISGGIGGTISGGFVSSFIFSTFSFISRFVF